MVVKGSIGEMCTVEARITEIHITAGEVIYSLDVNGYQVMTDDSFISFSDYFADPAEYEHKLQEAVIPEEPADITGLPVDDEWCRPAPKKHGRPRKATVEDMVKRAKGGDPE